MTKRALRTKHLFRRAVLVAAARRSSRRFVSIQVAARLRASADEGTPAQRSERVNHTVSAPAGTYGSCRARGRRQAPLPPDPRWRSPQSRRASETWLATVRSTRLLRAVRPCLGRQVACGDLRLEPARAVEEADGTKIFIAGGRRTQSSQPSGSSVTQMWRATHLDQHGVPRRARRRPGAVGDSGKIGQSELMPPSDRRRPGKETSPTPRQRAPSRSCRRPWAVSRRVRTPRRSARGSGRRVRRRS